MIIKSKSYKHNKAYKTVVDYVMREAEQDDSFVLTRFIKGKNLSNDAISKQFLENEQYRVNPRKNNVKLFMEILSFHSDNTKDLDNTKLKRIARKYLDLRSPTSVALVTAHKKEKDHFHLHILLSGTAYKTGQSVRISRDDFKNKVKIPAEQYVQKHFPELQLSAINHNPSKKKVKKALTKDAELQMQARGIVSDKQQLISALEEAYSKATSQADFYKKLQHQNIALYARNNTIVGAKLKRKFRFKTLGYTKSILQDLNKNLPKNKRLEALKRIRSHQEQQQSKDRDGRERTRKRDR